MFDSKAEMLRSLEASAPAVQKSPRHMVEARDGDTLTIATWNIEWLNAGLNRGRVKRDLGDLAALNHFARRLDADVVALQEVDGPEAARWVFPPNEY